MGVNEKLTEIVKKAAYITLPSNTADFHLNMLVTELISHGVTIVVRCKDCKYQEKFWKADKRMKTGGYYLYGCSRNDDPFVEHTVDGYDEDFCSYGERRDSDG